MADHLFDLQNKVAVITGGSGVLGSAMAKELSSRGVRIAILGRNQERANNAANSINDSGGTAIALSVDVTDRSSCESATSKISDHFGQIDFLINAAGGNHPGATATPEQLFYDLPADALRFAVDVNLMGTVLPCQTFGKVIAEQADGGCIVNIASMAGMRPLTKVVGYSAAKAAISNFTAWLSVYMCQFHESKVRVNAIAPGFFLTEQNRYLLTDKDTGAYTPRGQSVINQTPMDRFGEPDELTGTLVWLLSKASTFVTGAVIPVDGGFSAFSGV